MLHGLLLPLFLALAGCAPYLVVTGGAVNLDKVQEIQRTLVAIRGLKFTAEVPIEVKKEAEIRSYLEAELLKHYGEEKMKAMGLAYAKLGLLPSGVDLKKTLLDFYPAQVAAFYDPKGDKLVLPEDFGAGLLLGTAQFLAKRDILGEMVLAHELTHALQDQHFALERRLERADNDDRILALRAIVEGDATLAGFSAVLGRTDFDLLPTIGKQIETELRQKRSDFPEIPKSILEQLLFQYYGGVPFVSRMLEERGWLGVNFLYSAPPLSTEQVLHPEKYFDYPDPPTRIDLRSLSQLFAPDWREIENNVLGELMVEVLFREFLSQEEATVAAEGWDGDRFVAFRRGEEVSFIWATVWDLAQHAGEFFHRYREILSKKYGAAEAAATHAYIEQRGQSVVIVEGLESAHVREQIDKIWQGMELKEEPFKRPVPPLRRRPDPPKPAAAALFQKPIAHPSLRGSEPPMSVPYSG